MPKFANMSNYISSFPRQKIPQAKKNEKWAMECAKAAAEPIFQNNSNIRKSIRNKITNYNLRINKINLEDVEVVCNPHKLKDDTFPDTFKHIGRGNAYVNLLIGEKLKRPLNFKVFLSSKDRDGINKKEKDLKNLLIGKVQNMVMSEALNERSAQVELENLSKYLKYEYQDIREQTATKILKREVQRNDLKYKFAQCWEDALVCGEEVMYIDITGRDLLIEKVNPLQFYTLGSGYSEKVEDSDIIVWFDYKSVGQIVDRYYDKLTPKEIDELEEGLDTKSKARNPYSAIDNSLMAAAADSTLPNVTIVPPNISQYGGNFVDNDGNLLVTYVNWRSRKKIGELTYYDPLDGSEQKMIIPEGYPVDENKGEKCSWYWVNEWYKATLIKDDILVDWGPIEFQSRSPYQLSEGNPNFVGQYYNTNQGQVHSLMDVIKPLDYSYDIAYWKREQEIAANFGTMTFYNASMVPHGWDAEKWLNYAIKKKLAPLDPTQEILKGPSQNKSAGVFNTLTATAIQSQAYQDIRLYTEIMLSLEDQMAKVTGINRQREAQISPSETATATQVGFQQSSAITEPLFYKQSEFEKRALTLLLEKAKYLYSKYPQSGQYVFDEIGLEMIQDFSEISESHMDIYVANSGKELTLHDTLKQVSMAAVQSGQATMSDMVSIHLGESTQDLVRKLEASSERIARQQQESQARQIEAAQEEAEKERLYKQYKDEMDWNLKNRELDIKENIQIAKDNDTNRNAIKDEVEYEMKQLEVEEKRSSTDKKLASKATEADKERQFKRDIERMRLSNKIKTSK